MLLEFIKFRVLDLKNFDETLEADKMGLKAPEEEIEYRYRNIRRDYIVSIDEDYESKERTIITLINGDNLILDMPVDDVMSLIKEGTTIGTN